MFRPFAAALAVPVLLAGCYGANGVRAASESSVPVRAALAERRTFSTPVQLSGSLTALRSATVGASSPGRIVSMNVRVGDKVTAGDLLAQVDASQFSAQLNGARAGASAAADSERAARAQLAQAQSRLRFAQTTAHRMTQLYVQGAISRQQQDETQSTLAAARAAVEQAQASLSASAGTSLQAQAGVAAAEVPLQNASIVAPFDGVITQKFVDPGAVVGAGSPIVNVENTNSLELDVALPEDNAAALVPGTPVAVHVDALGAKTVAGSVRAILPSENAALRSATVKIAVAPRAGLLPGMFARVTVSGAAHTAVGVPVQALVERAGQSGVFAIENGVATFVPVQTGSSTARVVEVQGLETGKRVAITNVSRLTDRTKVTVTH